MCGICGFISKHKITYNTLKHMNDTMLYRGPDDSGEEICEMSQGKLIGLGHRRLSILDLSEAGHQPMDSPDGRITVVYNGEIYNYQELKISLSDYSFHSNCDTEVIIAAYLKWGLDCLERFNGMFAIALYDRKWNVLYLVRDRIGKKPLYYYWNEGELVFASGLKSIMEYPYFKKEINTEIIPAFLYHQYINAPESILKNTYKLEPGSILCYRNNNVKIWKYWDVADRYSKEIKHKKDVQSYEQAKVELKELLKNAVKMRMVADVPIGLFLSGGYDSSLVTAIAQSISNEPVHTYAIGFEEGRYNEAGFAKEVAKYLETIHTEYYITQQEMLNLIDSIPKYYDEPFADPSQVPSMIVASLAGKDVKVVLTGDGGDEFFCGYDIYDIVRQAQRLDLLGSIVYSLCSFWPLRTIGLIERLPLRVRIIAQNRDNNLKTQFACSSYFDFVNGMVKGKKKSVRYPVEGRYKESLWQMRRMLLDMDTYLPGDILCKVDRATMRYSMEARCPLLDYRIMEYSYRLPHEFKYQKGNKKRILKDIAYEYLPKKLLNRPKQGFGIPLDSWMRKGKIKEQLLDFSDTKYLKSQGIFDSYQVQNLLHVYLETGDGGAASGKNYSKIFWSFLCFQKWYQMYFL